MADAKRRLAAERFQRAAEDSASGRSTPAFGRREGKTSGPAGM